MRRARAYLTGDDVEFFLKGKGKGHRKHTTGKGFGRRKNPKDKDGNVMLCRKCGSDEHFEKNCPNNTGGAPAPNLLTMGAGRGSSQSSQPQTYLTGIDGDQGVEIYSTINQQPSTEVQSPWVAPPWSVDDFVNTADDELTIRTFMMNGGEEAADPFMSQDPWNGGRAPQMPQPPPQAASSGSLLYNHRLDHGWENFQQTSSPPPMVLSMS